MEMFMKAQTEVTEFGRQSAPDKDMRVCVCTYAKMKDSDSFGSNEIIYFLMMLVSPCPNTTPPKRISRPMHLNHQ
jgi:hypothetical protein